MLFSHPDVVAQLTEHFECAWEMVRPVPKITVDFGYGRQLERTLLGNVATYFTFADGRVFDLVPGLVDPVEYQRRLDQALGLHRAVSSLAEAEADRFVREYHADPVAWSDGPREEVVQQMLVQGLVADVSKARVEDPIKRTLRGLHTTRVLDDRTYVPAADGPGDHLLEDTAHNREVRNPKVRRMLAGQPLTTPAFWTGPVYREVLDTDLDDPYLGLAPYVLGGEGGRH